MTLFIVGALVAAAAYLLLRPGSTPRIDVRAHPNGLAVLEPIQLNGARQWVLIRSEDVANPVVLFLHGGPGTSQLTQLRRQQAALEAHFTVVDWDQRGAGKSFAAGRDGARMNMAQFVDDVVVLSEYLANRFRRRKILLVGHSWGSAIGLLAVARRPDLFSAYVGVGQMARPAEGEAISYAWTLEQARAAGDAAAVRKLAEIGPPPYTGEWRRKFLAQRQLLARFGGEWHGSRMGAFGTVLRNLVLSREYTFGDRLDFFRGIFRSLELLMPELQRRDFFAEVPALEVPVWFCLGRHDHEVPAVLAARYLEALRAPHKALVWFERSAHLPNAEEPDRFNRLLVEEVLPVALAEEAGAARRRGAVAGSR
jgi:pimeloyl-ACP methyl ester carboxylesterase